MAVRPKLADAPVSFRRVRAREVSVRPCLVGASPSLVSTENADKHVALGHGPEGKNLVAAPKSDVRLTIYRTAGALGVV